ncbi:serpin-ZX-like [Lotus japonicus]|uniref:serpin-ZX-like n=1 Tax=Lotus japonicus TaxID=34305 RepID=UPI0025834561|nr:serpin-ZX-like [Lotus japonicus]
MYLLSLPHSNCQILIMASIRIRGMVNKGLQVGRLLSRSQGFRGFYNIPSHLDKTLTSNQTDATLSITKNLFLKEEFQNKNVVFSPLSLYVALSMVAAGSEGPTLNEFLTFLRAKSTDHLNSFTSKVASVVLRDGAHDGGPRLCFSNGVWVEQSLPLIPSYKQLVATDYKATFASVDFKNKAHAVVNEVNLWAEEKTMGLIKNILDPTDFDNLTRLILANAMYFKGAWEEPFAASKTRDHDFQLLNGTSIKAPFMTSKKDQFIGVFDDFKVLRLSYDQGNDDRHFSMYIFLPNANDGLSALVEQVTSESEFLERHLPCQEVKVGDFRIPKFEISFGLDISNVVKEMGLVLPFSEDYADFTKIATPLDEPPLCVSNIVQKSFIEVNEEGTEAAVVTAIQVRCGSLRIRFLPKVIDFVADHPFLFIIREDWSKTILFTGQVLNPLHD